MAKVVLGIARIALETDKIAKNIKDIEETINNPKKEYKYYTVDLTNDCKNSNIKSFPQHGINISDEQRKVLCVNYKSCLDEYKFVELPSDKGLRLGTSYKDSFEVKKPGYFVYDTEKGKEMTNVGKAKDYENEAKEITDIKCWSRIVNGMVLARPNFHSAITKFYDVSKNPNYKQFAKGFDYININCLNDVKKKTDTDINVFKLATCFEHIKQPGGVYAFADMKKCEEVTNVCYKK